MANARLLTDVSTGHPFRRSIRIDATAPRHNDDNDLKLFALSFTAFFICFYTLIF